MTIATEIISALDGDAALKSLIGTDPVRLYPDVIAQGAQMPAVRFQLVTGQREQVLTGPCDLYNGRYQFDAFALTALEADAVRDALAEALQAAVAFSVVEGARLDFYEEATRRYRRTVEFSIWRNDRTGSPS